MFLLLHRGVSLLQCPALSPRRQVALPEPSTLYPDRHENEATVPTLKSSLLTVHPSSKS